MGSRTASLGIPTRQRCEMVDITSRVRDVIAASGVREGYVICYVPHTTAGLTIQENADPDVTRDLLYKLEQLVPHQDCNYRHDEGNSDAHIKASLMGSSQTVLIENGNMVLGRWQAIYFAEFDGPRQRDLCIRCIDTVGASQ